MNIPAWHVLTWKPCFTPVSDFFRMVPGMRHLATTSYVPSEDSGRTGQCLWGGEIDGQPVGLAWNDHYSYLFQMPRWNPSVEKLGLGASLDMLELTKFVG